MTLGPEKTHVARPPLAARAAEGSFFRKAGEDSFFGARDSKPFLSAPVQARLEVSQPDDPQEREADAVADSVMRMADPVTAPSAPSEEERDERALRSPIVQRTPMHGLLSRQEGAGGFASARCDEDAGSVAVQAKSTDDARSTRMRPSARGPPSSESGASSIDSAQGFESALVSSKGSGSALPGDVRRSMEERFGADFGDVRIHTGGAAEQLSSGIRAHAFTHGQDIYFNAGKYDPSSATGGRLLAHELTHTIQQGASRPNGAARVARSIQRTTAAALQRSEAGSQRAAAVEFAKAEEGKVGANRQGPDGKRVGWERLLEFFQTTFGPDKILPEGAAYQPGTVNEANIKTKSTFQGDVMGGDGRTVEHNRPRDVMPSWCGIFAFWALNKGGIPLKKWVLGGRMIPPEAAYPAASHEPQPGDIAYRQEFSHYGLVASSDGSAVTTINGNTAGDDNVGGEIQVQTHPRNHWFSFIDPTQMMDGALRAPGTPDAPGATRTRSLRELRQQLFNVDRRAEKEEADERLQPKSDDAHEVVEAAASGDASGSGSDDAEDAAANGGAAGGSCLSRLAESNRRFARAAAEQTSGSRLERAADPTSRAREDDVAAQDLATLERKPLSVQNRGPPARAPPQPLSIQRRIQRSWLGDAWDAVGSAVSQAAAWVERGLDAAKEWLLRQVRDFVRGIPGYSMLCLILAEDPITGAATPLTGASLLEAGLDLLPGGAMFRFLLIRLGIYADVATWLEGRIGELSTVGSGIAERFAVLWDGLSLERVANPDEVLNEVAALLRGAIGQIASFVEQAAVSFLERIKTVMVREIAAFVRARIPRLYPLLTVALGFDPETLQDVPRNGTNILNAFLEVSEEGVEQRKQMLETGTFQRIAGWIDRGIAVFSTAYALLKAAIAGIWDFVTIENLFSPIESFTRIYDTFAAPIGMVTQFLVDAAAEVLRLIKDAVLGRLSAFARTVRGVPLVYVIIGRDPFLGTVVPRTVHSVVQGFMSLMEGGEQQYDQLRESGAIDRIVAKVEAAVARLNMTPAAIIQLFIDLWNSFSIRDLAHPIEAFTRIVDTFGEPILRLIRFVIEIVMIVVEAVLILMSFPFGLIANIIAKARQAFELIKQDPAGFLKNLLRAIKQGFVQFFDNIATHLLNGLVGWLMRELRDAGVPVLTDFSLGGVITWVLEVLGISMERIWQKLAAHPRIGPARVARIRSMIHTLEGIWTFIKDVQERGMSAIWDRIQEQLTNLWETVLQSVKSWIMDRIINAVVTRLLSMLDPTGIMAVVNSAITLYRGVQSAIKYATDMLRVVNSFAEGTVEIAQGSIGRGADFLEGALDRAMPVAIGFLANQVGLSGIGGSIAQLIGRGQELVDRALTWLVNRAVDTGMALIDRALAFGRSAVAALTEWWSGEQQFTAADSSTHRVYFEGTEESSVLTIRSQPKPYTVFLQEYEARMTGEERTTRVSTPTGEKTKSEVLEEARTIAGLIEREKRRRVRGATEQETNENRTRKTAAIQELLGRLAAASVPLFGSAKPAPSEIVLPQGANNHVYAALMHAEKIHKIDAVTNHGSGPTTANHDLYDVINRRRKGNGSYYIRGHLLNERLGGPGMWTNMTALSQTGNREHERQVESRVKAAFDAGAVISYKVECKGNVRPSTPTVLDKSRFTGIRNIDQNFPIVQAIVAGESNVCQTLECTAFTMKQEGTTWVKDQDIVATTQVTNLVETDPSSYEISGN